MNFYNLGGGSDIWKSISSTCSSKSLTVGPIPSNVIAVWEEFNATVTGVMTSINGGVSRPSSTSSAGSTTRLRITGSATDENTITLVGLPTSVPAPLATTTGVAPLAIGGTGAAAGRGWDRDVWWVWTVGAVVVSGMWVVLIAI